MAKSKTTVRPSRKSAAKKAAKPTEAQVAAQEAQAELLASMQAAHASRLPDGEGSRHGRHKRARMPQARTVVKFREAVIKAIQMGRLTEKYVHVDGEAILSAGLGLTWLKTQHGWRANQTCARSAFVCGFTARLFNASTEERHVILRPINPEAFAADPEGYVRMNVAKVTNG